MRGCANLLRESALEYIKDERSLIITDTNTSVVRISLYPDDREIVIQET